MTIALGVMIGDELKELAQTSPFQKIRIVLADGQVFIVPHPDYVFVSPDRQTVHCYDEKQRPKILNAQQIRYVEPVKSRASKGKS